MVLPVFENVWSSEDILEKLQFPNFYHLSTFSEVIPTQLFQFS
jgi:hypothetical protein